MIVSDALGLASAAWIAERNEIWPVESFPAVTGLTATVSASVFT
jgi:hypothetical protein